ncbi:MAG: chromosome segregation protein SMC [Candidatus Melainabacteria bacterium]|nr:chromosome segregation protein SMC [Candidatus Melainabacteria bacterium]
MHIAQIEVENFKSFHGKTVIPFLPGFTTISGPNGSGKSNIIDSILFCLGLSSSRTMRAEKLTDLINNHSRQKEATVSIVFNTTRPVSLPLVSQSGTEASAVDWLLEQQFLDASQTTATSLAEESSRESSGLLASEGPPETLTISRRIRVGSSGYTSTYYLNGRPVTLGEVHETLARYHVSPGSYNVMMQGDVAGIVNMSALERRKIIDELAGVAEFDRKIEQAQGEIQATYQNIERNTILLSEIRFRLEQLAGERDKALRYQTLREKHQQLEVRLAIAHLHRLEQSLADARQGMVECRTRKRDGQQSLNGLQKTIEQTRAQLLELAQAVKHKGEDQQIAIKRQIEGLKGHVARKEDSIQFIDEKVAENARNVRRMEEEIERLTQAMALIDADLGTFEQQQAELKALYDQEKQSLEKLNQQFDTLTGASSQWTSQRSDIRQQIELVQDELATLNRQKLDKQAERQRIESEQVRQQQAWSDSASKRASLERRLGVLQTEYEPLLQRKEVLESEIREGQSDANRLRAGLNRVQDELQQLLREHASLDSKRRAYEEMNFGRSVELILKSGIEGIHGTLAQLCSVPDEYALALEIALGGRLQNVVVDDDQVAKACIQYLQQGRAGRATFLPMNKIQPARRLGATPLAGGIIDYALNLVGYEALYEDIVAFAVGETLVVEDIDSARRLLNRYRMVTLDGSLFEKSGAMSGGSKPGRGGQVFQANRVEQELQTLQRHVDEKTAEKQRLARHLTSLEAALEKAMAEYTPLVSQVSRYAADMDTLTVQISELNQLEQQAEGALAVDAKDAPGKASIDPLAAALKGIDRDLLALEKALTQAQNRLAEWQQALASVEQQLPSEQLEALRQQMAEVQFQMEYYDTQLRNAQTDLKGKQMERQYKEAGIADYRERIVRTQENSETIAQEKVTHRQEIERTLSQIEELEAQTAVLDEELQRLQAERDAVQATLIEQEKQKHLLERQVAQCDEQVLALQLRCRELEPLILAAKTQMEEAGMVAPQANVDETNGPSVADNEEELKEQVQKLTRQMQALEPVNMLAIQEYDEVTQRQQELAEKVETLQRETEALQAKIAGYEDLKRVYFAKAFDQVNQHFKTIFAELSDGTGQLLLTNPADPLSGGLTIEAQPRGKKLQRLESMSGGEKSLTSLAFVFSLQRTMPAPFYALDEVDMNLDGLNVEKLANMVKRESAAAQFMVVSLRKPMIERSDRTVGVTQKKNGITKVAGIQMHGGLSTEPADALPEESTLMREAS